MTEPRITIPGPWQDFPAFEQTPVGMAYLDRHGHWLGVNSALCHILQATRDELRRQKIQDRLKPEDVDADHLHLENLTQGAEQRYTCEVFCPVQDGAGIWLNISLNRIEGTNQPDIYLFAVIQDISRIKATELSCIASESTLRALHSAMNEGLALHEMVMDAEGKACDYRIIMVNESYSRILGLEKSVVEGRLASDVYQDSPPPYLELYAEVAESGVGKHFETEYSPMEKSFSISVFSPGPGRFATVFAEITQRKKTELNLKQALTDLERERGFLKSLIQNLPDLIWLKDTQGVYLSCNPSFEAFFGATEAEIVGKTDYDFVHENVADFFRAHDQKALQNDGPTINEEWITFASDGHRALLETTKTPMIGSNGEVLGVLGIGHDITDRKLSEQAILEGSQRYEAVLSSTRDGFWVVQMEGFIVDVNDAYCRFSGYTRDELIGKHVSELDSADSAEKVSDRAEQVVEQGNAIFEATHVRKDGSVFPVEVSISHSGLQGGQFFCFLRDIQERKESDKLLELRRILGEMVYTESLPTLLRTALDTAEEMTDSQIGYFHFVEKDQESVTLQTWSTRTLREMCYLKGEGLHYPISEAGVWVDCVKVREPVIHNDYEALVHKKGLPEGHAPVVRELTVPIFRGQKIVAVIGVGNKPKYYDDHDLSIVTRIANMAFDFVEHKQAEQQIQYMAYNDVLTGLPNRQLLADRLQQAIAQVRRNDEKLAICYIDLDGFKPINDSFGHDVGDQLLIDLGRRLTDELREGDTLSRLGGDEFVLLVGGLGSLYHGEEIVQRVLDIIAQPFEIDRRRMHISASIGVTFFPDDNVDPDTLLRHADQAMYQAKEKGKNTYSLFDPIQDKKVHAHQKALIDFAQAMAKYELCLFYQPRIDLSSGELASVEALIRWNHPQDGLLLPRKFLHQIKDTPLEIALDEWVIKAALEQHMAWRKQDLYLPVSVNLCTRHIQQRSFPQDLKKLLSHYPADITQYLELEILETSAIGDTSEVSEIMSECRDFGIHFSLDDFGTGYSSLTYFHRLPISVLKIDQHFVRDMMVDPRDQDIVEGVLRLADALKRPVVAEGVETIEHGLMLLQLGCQFAQGYGIAKPMPADSVVPWTKQWVDNQLWHNLNEFIQGPVAPYDLNVAIFSQKLWLMAVKNYITSGLTTLRPETNETNCPFTRWYRGIGEVRYGSRQPYPFIQAKHNEIHELGMELVLIAEHQSVEKAQSRLDELDAMSADLIALLNRLNSPE
ncbi:MAG: EAL domain-containing protein [Candidatus Thiodiazotropha sp.]